jgi:hypothetical protein
MKHTRPAVAGATAMLAASLIGVISAAPANAQPSTSRITSAQQLSASIQQAVAREQSQSMDLSCCPAGFADETPAF